MSTALDEICKLLTNGQAAFRWHSRKPALAEKLTDSHRISSTNRQTKSKIFTHERNASQRTTCWSTWCRSTSTWRQTHILHGYVEGKHTHRNLSTSDTLVEPSKLNARSATLSSQPRPPILSINDSTPSSRGNFQSCRLPSTSSHWGSFGFWMDPLNPIFPGIAVMSHNLGKAQQKPDQASTNF